MRLPFVGLVVAASVLTLSVVTFSACSGGDARPDAGSGITPGSSGNIGSSGGTDSGSDSGSDGGDSGSCSNNAKDGSETDVDCGGQCAPCADGKICTKKEDCEQGHECEVATAGKPEKKCRIGTCSDGIPNGAETDIDCGGTSGCNPCTVGKRCAANSDCRSESCNAGTCACPPNMAIVPLTGGGAYCIDSAEVTKGQYFGFVNANVAASTQTGACAGNSLWTPADGWPASTDPPTQNGRAYNYGLPVHYVDWCDAVGYCKWAKKELCGKIGGGAVPQNQASVAGTAAWYNACSSQGGNAYPYGAEYQASKCNDVGGADGGVNGYGYVVNKDDGLWRVANSDTNGNITGGYVNMSCAGTGDLYQMAGNAAEWENSCADETTPGALCNVRGGSFNSAEEEADAGLDAGAKTRCDSVRQLARNQGYKDVGFRCCLY